MHDISVWLADAHDSMSWSRGWKVFPLIDTAELRALVIRVGSCDLAVGHCLEVVTHTSKRSKKTLLHRLQALTEGVAPFLSKLLQNSNRSQEPYRSAYCNSFALSPCFTQRPSCKFARHLSGPSYCNRQGASAAFPGTFKMCSIKFDAYRKRYLGEIRFSKRGICMRPQDLPFSAYRQRSFSCRSLSSKIPSRGRSQPGHG